MSRPRDPLAPPPAPAPRRLDGEEIVDAIVTATIELDDPEASVNAIAERAGVGVASLYRYFPSKAAIFAEIYRRTLATYEARIRAILADDGLDLHAAIAACIRAAIEIPTSDRLRRQFHLAMPGTWTHPEFAASFGPILGAMTEQVARRMANPPPDLATRVFVAYAATRGAIIMAAMLPAMRPDDDTLIEHLTRGALAYLEGAPAIGRAP
jgi:AcrR family transcriptional regulator